MSTSSNYAVLAAYEEIRGSRPDYYANAKSVIDAALERGMTFDEVLCERFPPGAGGVGHAHARTRREIQEQIREFYAPVRW